MKKDLIFGLAIGYNFEKIKIFVDSLKRTNFDGELVIIAGDPIDFPANYHSRFQIRTLIEPRFKRNLVMKVFARGMTAILPAFSKNLLARVLKSIKNENAFLNWFIRTHYPATGRFAFYYKFLKENNGYRNILLTDIRDVYFQENPFNGFDSTLAIFEESSSCQIKNEKFNSLWVEKGFGKKNLDLIGHNIACCSGTIMGSYKGMMQFLKIFIDTCIKYNVPYSIKGVDQGIFNFLVYSGRISFAEKHVNGRRILTLGTQNIEEVKIINSRFIYNNVEPSIVHQFDRHESTYRFVNNAIAQSN